MKQLKSMAIASIAIFTLMVFFSCGSGKDKTTEATTDTTAVTGTDTVTATTPAEPDDMVVIRHKVQNFAKWLPAFEAHDSARAAAGLTKFIVGRGVEDSNMVIIYLKMADTAKAKAFSASPDLKAVMQKAGVIGKPVSTMLDVVTMDTSPIEQTARVMVTFKNKDWDAWKKSFDGDKQNRIDNGLIDRGVGHVMGDPKTGVLVFAVTDEAKVKAFMGSKELRARMDSAGVVGQPTSYFYNVVKKY